MTGNQGKKRTRSSSNRSVPATTEGRRDGRAAPVGRSGELAAGAIKSREEAKKGRKLGGKIHESAGILK